MQPMAAPHPVEFDVDYPDRQLRRVSTLLRAVYAIPILIVLAFLGGPALGAAGDNGGLYFIGLASGLVVIPPLLTIVFRQKYPRSHPDQPTMLPHSLPDQPRPADLRNRREHEQKQRLDDRHAPDRR